MSPFIDGTPAILTREASYIFMDCIGMSPELSPTAHVCLSQLI